MKVEQEKRIASNAIEQLRKVLEAGQVSGSRNTSRQWPASGAITTYVFLNIIAAQRDAHRFAEAERYRCGGLPRLA